jgi:hypothetical protein
MKYYKKKKWIFVEKIYLKNFQLDKMSLISQIKIMSYININKDHI